MQSCLHCGQKAKCNFCCNGCKAAYKIIDGLGLDSYYRNRVLDVAVQSIKPDEGEFEVSSFINFVSTNESGEHALHVMVEGIHCASCVWLIESALQKQENITHARINMSTRRLVIKWQGDKKQGGDYIKLIRQMGYKLMPFDPETLQTEDKLHEKFLLKCIAISGFASGNLMMLSVAMWAAYGGEMGQATKSLFHFISAIIAIPTVLYSGQIFFKSSKDALKNGRTNMDVPISVGVILAVAISVFESFTNGEYVFFESAVMLIFFLLIGRYLDHRVKVKARGAAHDLLMMMSGTATVLENNKQIVVPIKELKVGQEIMVAVGEKIPADGVIIKGNSEIDTSIVTGETMPVSVVEGAEIFAGTINVTAPLIIRTINASDNSLLSEIISLMENAEQGQAKYVRLADKVASFYTPVVHALGLLTFLGWWLLMEADWQLSLLNAVTVLIITCPCALGLAVPVVQVLASGRLFKQGILLKSGDALEKLAKVDYVVFDKTGTLTMGTPELKNGSECPSHLMELAASMAAKSKHPLSVALAGEYHGDLLDVEVEEIAGYGIEAKDGDKIIRLGRCSWCGDDESAASDKLELWLSSGEEKFCFLFDDELREDSVDVVHKLQKSGFDMAILSGDRMAVVKKVAAELGICNYQAELSPVDKCNIIQENENNVMMVGDGLNDAPALANAYVSISPSTAINITQNTADIVFQGKKLAAIIESIEVAKKSSILVKQNFALAFIYNIFAIPLAVSGNVTPLIAAVAMSGSSLIVIANALRLNLRKKK